MKPVLDRIVLLGFGFSKKKKSNQRKILLQVTKNGRTKEMQDSNWVQKISDMVGKLTFLHWNEGEVCVLDLQRKCCCDERWQHYENKHQSYMSCTGDKRVQKVKQMAASLLAQQKCFFFHAHKTQENATTASYEVAHLIAWHKNSSSDGDFIKECLTEVAGIMCPEKIQEPKT